MRTVDIRRSWMRSLLASSPRNRPTGRAYKGRPPGKTDDGTEWCTGGAYVFLGPRLGHFRRSNYSERVMRPAADGWHPARGGRSSRCAMPVLVDASAPFPGKPLPPWPAAEPDAKTFNPPRGRGRIQLPGRDTVGVVAPIMRGLTRTGYRHGHETWMDEAGNLVRPAIRAHGPRGARHARRLQPRQPRHAEKPYRCPPGRLGAIVGQSGGRCPDIRRSACWTNSSVRTCRYRGALLHSRSSAPRWLRGRIMKQSTSRGRCQYQVIHSAEIVRRVAPVARPRNAQPSRGD